MIATGVSYRTLDIPSLEPFNGVGVYYGAAISEAPALAGQEVFVVGGGNSAGQAAVYLAKFASRVTILVRGESLAQSMSDYLITEIDATANIDVMYGVEVVGGAGDGRLETIDVRRPTVGSSRHASRRRALHPHRRRALHPMASVRRRTRRLGLRDHRTIGRQLRHACHSSPRFPACSPSVTCDATRPSASRRLPEKAPCAYGSCTSTSPTESQGSGRITAHAGKP